MPAVHGCLHERSLQNSSTESSFLASTNPVLILTTESFRRGRQPSVLPRCYFRQSPKSHRSTASALLRFTRIQATNPCKITPVVTTGGALCGGKHHSQYPRGGDWLPNLLPHLEDRVTTSALNVPIQRGSLLDVSLAFIDDSITVDAVNDAIRSASRSRPELIQVSEDPIVSSDVIGQSCTVLFDAPGTIKAGSRMIKLLGWYENLGHAARLLDVARLYTEMEAAGV